MPSTRFSLATPPPDGRGAIAIVELAGDIDAALEALGIGSVAPGQVRLRSLGGVDTGLVARWTADSASLMPHGGAAVLSGLEAVLRRAGLSPRESIDPISAHPEAASLVEARMLEALAAAASPLAVDLLLDQPRRWEAWESGGAHGVEGEAEMGARSRRLNRLLRPPLVVALGRPNIGKSSLLNALAGRTAALVADQSGTTRDYVGATLDLAGLVVRYLDLPGIGSGVAGGDETGEGDAAALHQEAQRLALDIARDADLVLLCCDAGAPPLPPPAGAPSLVVALRSDLGLISPAASDQPPVAVSVRLGTGLEALVARVREALVPAADLAHPGPWRFWDP